MAELSERQRAFYRYVVQGYSQAEAYVKAGYSKRGARANAARMIAIDSVAAEVARLRKDAENDAVAGRRERMERLTKVVRGSDDYKAISAIQELNKMDGAYKPEEKKVEVTGNLGVSALLGVLGVVDMEPLAK